MKEPAPSAPDAASNETALRRVSIFANLPDEQRAQIAAVADRSLYAAGEAIVRQGNRVARCSCCCQGGRGPHRAG